MNVLRLVPPQGDAILVSQDRVLVGRDAVCDVHLRDASVSRQHAEILREGETWVIADLGSGNGILIDGVKTARGALAPGQELRLGNVRLHVEVDPGNDGATMILGARSDAFADTVIARHPPRDPDVALANPFGDRSKTRLPPQKTAPAPSPARQPRTAWIIVAILAFAGGAWLTTRSLQPPSSEAPRLAGPVRQTTPPPVATPEPAGVEAAASPAASTPPEPTALPPSPSRGLLLITSDERARFSIDGQPQPPLFAGEMRRVEVMPGEHLLSFDAGDGRRDQVVRAVAREQSVVRFAGSTTSAAPPAAPPPAPPSGDAPQGRATAPGASAVTPGAPPSAAPAVPAGTTATDEGLESGIAATRRGDFYRALLVLKDATRRLDDDPRAVSELARANAFLAWTYHALDRVGEAVVAAEKAARLDPTISGRLDDFPPPVRALFNRAR